MQVNDLFHGFRVKSVSEVKEINAKMWRMEYEKNGADLVWFEREDANANMTFGIGFKTVPEDDTGVFHIIEHSVLCGSEKYPVKDPFVGLIKTSVNTFLNAFTYNDKTVYPVCSCTNKDFLNLIDVYLDAVFHPLSGKNPLAFLQEGWHWEIGDDGKASASGVVYSEMKGAFANPDRVLWRELYASLFPDNCYSKESGGDPAHICELTYEEYLASLRRYYSASNSRIFLDGMIDADAVFEKLDCELSKHERIEVNSDIPFQAPVAPEERTVYYPVGDDEDTKGKTMMAKAWVFADFRDHLKLDAASVLFSVLCGNPEAPLKKAVTDSGLAQDVSLFVDDGIQQIPACLNFKNTDPENVEKLWKLAEDVIKKCIDEGIDKEELEATLNSYEFGERQQEDGLKGLSVGLAALDDWLYGGDPASSFDSMKNFGILREKIADGSRFYENLLKDIFFDCSHKASIVLVPSQTLAKEQIEAEEKRCADAAAEWTPAQRKKILDDMAELKRWQDTDDSEIADGCMPKLKLGDINAEMKALNPSVDTLCGLPLLRNHQDTNGIIYGNLFFEVNDLDPEEMHLLDILQKMFADQKTSKHTASEVMHIIKRDTGFIGNSIHVMNMNAKPEEDAFRTFLKISFGSLEVKEKETVDILSEVLTLSDYSDIQKIRIIVKNAVASFEKSIKSNGTVFARRRAASMLRSSSAVSENVFGIEALLRYRETRNAVATDEGAKALAARLQALAAKVFCRSRLCLSVTGKMTDPELERLVSALPEGEKPGKAYEWKAREKFNEGIELPSPIGFSATGGRFDSSFPYDGSAHVVSQILSYDFLWGEVRVKNGAYGTGMRISYDSFVSYTSYRDPQPANSLDAYKKCADYLREIAEENDFESFIIATYGSAAGLLTPRSETGLCEGLWLENFPFDNPERVRKAILATDRKRLYEIADMLERIQKDSVSVVIAGAEQLKACGEKLDKITKIF